MRREALLATGLRAPGPDEVLVIKRVYFSSVACEWRSWRVFSEAQFCERCYSCVRLYLKFTLYLLKYAPNNVHFSFLELCPLTKVLLYLYKNKVTGNNELNHRN